MSLDTYHRLNPRDWKRIKCTIPVGKRLCGQAARICRHNHFDSGNTKGISFDYMCLDHAPEIIQNSTNKHWIDQECPVTADLKHHLSLLIRTVNDTLKDGLSKAQREALLEVCSGSCRALDRAAF